MLVHGGGRRALRYFLPSRGALANLAGHVECNRFRKRPELEYLPQRTLSKQLSRVFRAQSGKCNYQVSTLPGKARPTPDHVPRSEVKTFSGHGSSEELTNRWFERDSSLGCLMVFTLHRATSSTLVVCGHPRPLAHRRPSPQDARRAWWHHGAEAWRANFRMRSRSFWECPAP